MPFIDRGGNQATVILVGEAAYALMFAGAPGTVIDRYHQKEVFALVRYQKKTVIMAQYEISSKI